MLVERSGTPMTVSDGRETIAHLSRGVAAQDERAALVEQRLDALVVVHAPVDEPHGAAGIQTTQHERLEQAGHAGGRGDGVPETVVPQLLGGRLVVVEPAVAHVRVDVGVGVEEPREARPSSWR